MVSRFAIVVVFAIHGALAVDVSGDIAVSAMHTRVSTAVTGGDPFEDSSNQLGHIEQGGSSTGTSAAGSTHAFANQFAAIPNTVGPTLVGHREVGVSLNVNGTAGYSAEADAQLDVSFEVTVDGWYELIAAAHWEGIVTPITGSAFVQLSDDTNSTTLALARADVKEAGPGFDSEDLGAIIPLQAGITYRIASRAIVTGNHSIAGEFFANAFASFELFPILPGDYDGDDTVSSADFDLWKSTFGSTEDLSADGDRNGVVDAADYTVWRDNLGAALLNGADSAGVSPSVNNVPEPMGAILFVVTSGAMIGVGDWRKQKRARVRH